MSKSDAHSEIEIEQTRTDRSTSNPLAEDDEPGELERLRARVSALERQIAVSQKQLTDAGIEIQVVASGGKLELVGEEAAVALDGGKDEGANDVMTEYFATSTTKILMGRLPWLFVLLLIQSSAAAIMATFEQLLDKELVIALFVPMIVGSGGNAGNQPGVAVTRALGAGEISSKSLWRLITRETGLGFITACILGTVAFFRVLVEVILNQRHQNHPKLLVITQPNSNQPVPGRRQSGRRHLGLAVCDGVSLDHSRRGLQHWHRQTRCRPGEWRGTNAHDDY
mmetsp:Transcript_60808/g.166993  ORF Transcript_60808/g.166993 Transcript_60808/m.166993 type:complete len:282 (-) Transcript_60808:411-1256(-)